MQPAIDKVMYAYALMANLTPDQVKATRDRLAAHLAGIDADENVLAVEGMRYLRGADRCCKAANGQKNPIVNQHSMVNGFEHARARRAFVGTSL